MVGTAGAGTLPSQAELLRAGDHRRGSKGARSFLEIRRSCVSRLGELENPLNRSKQSNQLSFNLSTSASTHTNPLSNPMLTSRLLRRCSPSIRSSFPAPALLSPTTLSRPAFSSSAMCSSVPPFRLTPPTAAEEEADFQAQVAEASSFMSSPRFATTARPYSPELVATKRGTQAINPLHPSNVSAQKLFALLSQAASEGRAVRTMGAIDPVQQSQMAAHLEVVYVSGWATSSVLTMGNEVGPDLADYSYLSVPNQVQRLRKAQELHDRKMWDERRVGDKGKQPWVDYLRPIIADGDTG